jgi:hypothetical protein
MSRSYESLGLGETPSTQAQYIKILVGKLEPKTLRWRSFEGKNTGKVVSANVMKAYVREELYEYLCSQSVSAHDRYEWLISRPGREKSILSSLTRSVSGPQSRSGRF